MMWDCEVPLESAAVDGPRSLEAEPSGRWAPWLRSVRRSPWPPAEHPEVRGCPAPRAVVCGGPMHVPVAGSLSFPGPRRPGPQSPEPDPGLVRPTLLLPAPGHFSAQGGPLLRWLKVNFSEAFIAWIHIKALRVFVESVLRYGLPVNFQAVLLQPHKKSSAKRLREVLNSVFRHLDEVAATSILDASVEIPGLQLSNQDYFPYVYFHIDLSLLD
ncbi:hypothetical protein P7K49_028512 [Saguinus oedipus]|uniref:V-type proton ATPase subunit C n=1 Tax=Saguinus oedipus TaxID=9490 RepID=A0ABQ9U4I8_SAGOE|nr:hypothetical protein P7K49_028512 [Saguinus oedipus]